MVAIEWTVDLDGLAAYSVLIEIDPKPVADRVSLKIGNSELASLGVQFAPKLKPLSP